MITVVILVETKMSISVCC